MKKFCEFCGFSLDSKMNQSHAGCEESVAVKEYCAYCGQFLQEIDGMECDCEESVSLAFPLKRD